MLKVGRAWWRRSRACGRVSRALPKTVHERGGRLLPLERHHAAARSPVRRVIRLLGPLPALELERALQKADEWLCTVVGTLIPVSDRYGGTFIAKRPVLSECAEHSGA